MAPPDVLQLSVVQEDAGMRLDAYISRQVTDCTRSHAAQLIRQGCIQVDGVFTKPSHKIKTSEQITIDIPPPEPVELVPEAMPLDILFEDAHLIVINKPPGLVVHPAAGHPSGTLVNGILHHCPDLEGIGGEIRPGIVHRLDKDTSGAIVVAKTSHALAGLAEQFRARQVVKRYLALVHGIPTDESGAIDLPVGRHPVDRKKMSTRNPQGRGALTLWRIKERFQGTALLEVELKTGRTHQIRVHCQSMGHPLVGDRVYGHRKPRTVLSRYPAAIRKILGAPQRQLLHAAHLEFSHPATSDHVTIDAKMPPDMVSMLDQLRSYSGA
jgi:23S rRNA pseudouridine1911/1915/1917 synthase